MNEEKEELALEESVPETLENSAEEQVQTDTSTSEEQVQEEKQEEVQEERKYTQKELDTIIASRFAREKSKQERETAKYKELENIMKFALKANDIDDVILKSKEFYKDSGVDIPDYHASLNAKEEKILAEAYAKEIIDTGDYSEMEEEANRISNIPAEQRTARENVMFNMLCQELTERKNKSLLQTKGYDVNILEDRSFNEFRKKLNYNTSIIEAVDMYKKLNSEIKQEKPASAGSAKNEVQKEEEIFSIEKINSMTPQELMKHWNNPAFRKVAGLN